jgi:hypothetical protein
MRIIKIADDNIVEEYDYDYFDGLKVKSVSVLKRSSEPEEGTIGPESFFVGTNHYVEAKVEMAGTIPLVGLFSPEKFIANYYTIVENNPKHQTILDILDRSEASVLKDVEFKIKEPSLDDFQIADDSIIIKNFTFMFELSGFEPGDPSVVNKEYDRAWSASRREF